MDFDKPERRIISEVNVMRSCWALVICVLQMMAIDTPVASWRYCSQSLLAFATNTLGIVIKLLPLAKVMQIAI